MRMFSEVEKGTNGMNWDKTLEQCSLAGTIPATFTCSNATIEILEKGVKYVQS